MVVTRSQARAAAAAAAAAAPGDTSSPSSAAAAAAAPTAAAAAATSKGTAAITENMAALQIDRKANTDSILDDLLKGKPEISDGLYKKAVEDNKSLSKLERILLFSRCDVWGKAFAGPDTLTEAQRNIVLDRPPPEIMAQNIRDATDGAMSTIAELRSVDVGALGLTTMTLISKSYQTSDIHKGWAQAFDGRRCARKHDYHNKGVLSQAKLEYDEDARCPEHRAADVCRTSEEDAWEDEVLNAFEEATWDSDEHAKANPKPEPELMGHREEKERLEPEMRAQLAEKIGKLSTAEKVKLAELVRAEKERNKAEDDAFEALWDELGAKGEGAQDERELERQIEREERKEAERKMKETQKGIQKEKRKMLGVDESDDDDDDDDEEDEDDYSEDDSLCTDGGKSVVSDKSRD
ncbi:hypothetical protein RB597_000658 [Gaeumannomyces tritici]